MKNLKKFILISLSVVFGLVVSIGMIIATEKLILPYFPDVDNSKNALRVSGTSEYSQINFKKIKIEPLPEPRKYSPEEMEKLVIKEGVGNYSSLRAEGVTERIEESKWMYIDPIIGRTQLRFANARHQLFYKDKFIFNVNYRADEFGRRITPVEHPDKRTEFFTFFGCSFTYGHGVQENETLPYYIGKELPNYLPINYAIGGAGGNLTLALLQSRDLKKEIKQKNGIGMYLYIDDHLERIIGTSFWSTSQPFTPYYFINHDGKAERRGTFETGKPIRTYLYKKLHESNFRKKFNMRYPLWVSDSDRDLVCGVMEQMKIEFLKQYPESKFYIGFLPGAHRDFDSLSKCLDKRQVSYLDLRNTYRDYDLNATPMVIEIDGHPNANGNKLVANAIIELLKLK